ncbi:hypothetical protein ACLBX9_00795 [Methylobacterium sp. A49B]
MDYVPSMAAVVAATQRGQTPETGTITAAATVATTATAALDPRSIFALSPEAADVVLTLAQIRIQPIQVAESDNRPGHGSPAVGAAIVTAMATTSVVIPEASKTVSAANRTWTEDVRLEAIPSRKVGADLSVQYDNPRVMAAWSAAFPDIAGRKFRGLQLSDTHLRSSLAKLAAENIGFSGLERDIYLLCNDEKFRIFSAEHPETKVNWIYVDNDDVLLFWPKEPGSDTDAVRV